MSLSSLGKSLQDSSRQKIEWVPGTGGRLSRIFPGASLYCRFAIDDGQGALSPDLAKCDQFQIG